MRGRPTVEAWICPALHLLSETSVCLSGECVQIAPEDNQQMCGPPLLVGYLALFACFLLFVLVAVEIGTSVPGSGVDSALYHRRP